MHIYIHTYSPLQILDSILSENANINTINLYYTQYVLSYHLLCFCSTFSLVYHDTKVNLKIYGNHCLPLSLTGMRALNSNCQGKDTDTIGFAV